jgi:hypothetical protein
MKILTAEWKKMKRKEKKRKQIKDHIPHEAGTHQLQASLQLGSF